MLKQLSVIAIALLATQANAAVGQPFVTFGFGQSSYSDACEVAVGDCDDKDTAFRIGAGVEFAPMYAVELTYLNHGEAADQFSTVGYAESYTLKADTIALQGSAFVNVAPQFNVYGKAGIALTQADVDYSERGFAFGVGYQLTESRSSDTTGLIVSVGAQYALMPNLMADIQVDYLPSAVDFEEFNFDSNITTISVGAKYQF